MKTYQLTAWDLPAFVDEFTQTDDYAAVIDATGFIRCLMKPDPTLYVSRSFDLQEVRHDESTVEATMVGTCKVLERDRVIDQHWDVKVRRWRHVARDMNVGDPHDE
ncbi:hypothetical protein BH10PSE2_BH10PSE2_11900 [soil metagenome]